MQNLNLTENNLNTIHHVSNVMDMMGNLTLGLATIIGLVSIDIVLLIEIFNEEKKHRHSRNDAWEIFWFSRWYSNCCYHRPYYPPTRMNDNDAINFLVATVIVSFLCTTVAIILALHFHLFILAMILASVWGMGFALKGLAYMIDFNLPKGSIFPEATASRVEPPLVEAQYVPIAHPYLGN